MHGTRIARRARRRRGLSVILLLLGATAAAPAQDPEVRSAGTTLAERIARRLYPRADAVARGAAGARLEVGALQLEFDGGALVALQDASGAPLGLAWTGRGRLRLRPDPAAEAVTRHNVRRQLGRSRLQEGAIVASVRSLLAVGRSSAIPAYSSLPAAGEKEERRLSRELPAMLDRYDSLAVPPVAHVLAEADFNGIDGPFLHVLMETDAGDLLFVRDAVRDGRDWLHRLWRHRKVFTPEAVTAWPAVVAHPAPFRQITTGLDLAVDGGSDSLLGISGTLRGVVSRSGQRVLRFDLLNHQAGWDVPWEGKARRLELLGVVDRRGERMATSHRAHELLVDLGRSLDAGEQFSFTFRLAADIAVRPGGDNYFVLRTLPWFPRSPGNAEAYRLHWTARTPAPFLPLMSGDTLRTETSGGDYIREAATDPPVRFASMTAGSFHCQEFPGAPLVRICTYAGPQPRVADDVAEYFSSLAGILGAALVPYPFSELTVVQLPAYDLAQSSPGMILLSQEILQPNADPISRVLGSDAAKRMAHELAHTWWGQIVKYRGPEDRWLSEAFAEYFGGLALAAVAGPQVLDRLRTVWRGAAERAGDAATVATAYLLSGEDGFPLWWDVMYGRGALTVDALRLSLGDEAFFRSLRRLIRDRARGFASTADLIEAIHAETGRDVSPLLDRWLHGTELPPSP